MYLKEIFDLLCTSKESKEILSKLNCINAMTNVVYFKEIIDNEYISLVESKLNDDNTDDNLTLLCGIIIFYNKKHFYSGDIKNLNYKKTDKYVDNIVKSIKYLLQYNNNNYNGFKFHLLHVLSFFLRRMKDKTVIAIYMWDMIKCEPLQYDVLCILYENRKLFNESKLVEYLSNINSNDLICFDSSIDYLKKLRSMFNTFKLDSKFIDVKIDSIVQKVDGRIKNTKMCEMNVIIELNECDIISYSDLDDFISKSKSLVSVQVDLLYKVDDKFDAMKSITIVDEEKNYVNSIFETNRKLHFRCVVRHMIDEFKNKLVIDDLILKINSSKISDDLKSQILESVNGFEGGVSNLLLIDSLSSKFEPILREFLKSKKIDTTFLKKGISEELTLGNDSNGIISKIIEYLVNEEEINVIKYVNFILNDRELQFNIRNKVSHGFYKHEDYNENKLHHLLFCLVMIIDTLF